MQVNRRGFLKAVSVIGASLCVFPQDVMATLSGQEIGKTKPSLARSGWEKKHDKVRMAAKQWGKDSPKTRHELAEGLVDWFNDSGTYKFPKRITRNDLKFVFEHDDSEHAFIGYAEYKGVYYRKIRQRKG